MHSVIDTVTTVGRTITTAVREINPSTLGGAIDIVVVRHRDGSLPMSVIDGTYSNPLPDHVAEWLRAKRGGGLRYAAAVESERVARRKRCDARRRQRRRKKLARSKDTKSSEENDDEHSRHPKSSTHRRSRKKKTSLSSTSESRVLNDERIVMDSRISDEDEDDVGSDSGSLRNKSGEEERRFHTDDDDDESDGLDNADTSLSKREDESSTEDVSEDSDDTIASLTASDSRYLSQSHSHLPLEEDLPLPPLTAADEGRMARRRRRRRSRKDRHSFYVSSPFYVKFGKTQLLMAKDVHVSIEVNNRKVPVSMKLGHGGEAYFAIPVPNRDRKEFDESLLTSPPLRRLSAEGIGEDELDSVPPLKLEATNERSFDITPLTPSGTETMTPISRNSSFGSVARIPSVDSFGGSMAGLAASADAIPVGVSGFRYSLSRPILGHDDSPSPAIPDTTITTIPGGIPTTEPVIPLTWWSDALNNVQTPQFHRKESLPQTIASASTEVDSGVPDLSDARSSVERTRSNESGNEHIPEPSVSATPLNDLTPMLQHFEAHASRKGGLKITEKHTGSIADLSASKLTADVLKEHSEETAAAAAAAAVSASAAGQLTSSSAAKETGSGGGGSSWSKIASMFSILSNRKGISQQSGGQDGDTDSVKAFFTKEEEEKLARDREKRRIRREVLGVSTETDEDTDLDDRGIMDSTNTAGSQASSTLPTMLDLMEPSQTDTDESATQPTLSVIPQDSRLLDPSVYHRSSMPLASVSDSMKPGAIRMSLCAHLLHPGVSDPSTSSSSDWRMIFDQNQISFERLSQDPSLAMDPRLVFCTAEHTLYPARVAYPLILSRLLFGKELPKETLSQMAKHENEARNDLKIPPSPIKPGLNSLGSAMSYSVTTTTTTISEKTVLSESLPSDPLPPLENPPSDPPKTGDSTGGRSGSRWGWWFGRSATESATVIPDDLESQKAAIVEAKEDDVVSAVGSLTTTEVTTTVVSVGQGLSSESDATPRLSVEQSKSLDTPLMDPMSTLTKSKKSGSMRLSLPVTVIRTSSTPTLDPMTRTVKGVTKLRLDHNGGMKRVHSKDDMSLPTNKNDCSVFVKQSRRSVSVSPTKSSKLTGMSSPMRKKPGALSSDGMVMMSHVSGVNGQSKSADRASELAVESDTDLDRRRSYFLKRRTHQRKTDHNITAMSTDPSITPVLSSPPKRSGFASWFSRQKRSTRNGNGNENDTQEKSELEEKRMDNTDMQSASVITEEASTAAELGSEILDSKTKSKKKIKKQPSISLSSERAEECFIKSVIPTDDMLKSMDLRKGRNKIKFTVWSTLQGTQSVEACIYLWDSDASVVISDVDGTITKSDVMGHVMPWIIGLSYAQKGVAKLFSDVRSNGYHLLYLTSRGIGQASMTRAYLFEGVKEKMDPSQLTPLISSSVRRSPAVQTIAEHASESVSPKNHGATGDLSPDISEESLTVYDSDSAVSSTLLSASSLSGMPRNYHTSAALAAVSGTMSVDPSRRMTRAMRMSDHSRRRRRSSLRSRGKSDAYILPRGPVIMSPDSLFVSGYREIIIRKPQEFKIPALMTIRMLFPADRNPLFAAFGNRDTDTLSYMTVGVPKPRIFLINPTGDVTTQNKYFHSSYLKLDESVDLVFPDLFSHFNQSALFNDDFNDMAYWRTPLNIENVSDITDESEEDSLSSDQRRRLDTELSLSEVN